MTERRKSLNLTDGYFLPPKTLPPKDPFSEYAVAVGIPKYTEALLTACQRTRATCCSHGSWIPAAVRDLLEPRSRLISSLTAVASLSPYARRCLTLAMTTSGGQCATIHAVVTQQDRLEAQMAAVNTYFASILCFKDCASVLQLDTSLEEAHESQKVEPTVLLGLSQLLHTLAAQCAKVPLWVFLKKMYRGDVTPLDPGPETCPFPCAVVPGTAHIRVPSLLRQRDPIFSTPMDEIHAVLYFNDATTEVVATASVAMFSPSASLTVSSAVRAWQNKLQETSKVIFDLSALTQAKEGGPTVRMEDDPTAVSTFGVSLAAGLGVSHVLLPFPASGSHVPLYNEWIRVAESIRDASI